MWEGGGEDASFAPQAILIFDTIRITVEPAMNSHPCDTEKVAF